jgi:DNA replication protein DnaC
MTEAELIAKNEELKRRQAEFAASRAPTTAADIIAPREAAEESVSGSADFKARIAGLITRIQNTPREIDPEREEMSRKVAENENERRVKISGVPGRYQGETFDTYHPRSEEEERNAEMIRAYVQASIKSYPGVLVILGAVGTGKSHLGCACLQERSGLYADIPTLEIEVECSRDFSAPENKLQVLNRYARTDFLVIDEIGRASNPAAEKAILYYLMNKRYNENRPTVLITNFTDKELAAYVGSALIDRIAEKRVRVEFTGPSYRRGAR